MKVFGIVGWKNAGKTELVVKLVQYFNVIGVPVSTIKHAHHEFDIDVPGKDSFRHREAGANEVIVASKNRYALMHENQGPPEPDLVQLLSKLDPVPLVLVEGFKSHQHKKLEVIRGINSEPLIAASDPDVLAVATDTPQPNIPLPLLDLNDIEAIAGFILEQCGLT